MLPMNFHLQLLEVLLSLRRREARNDRPQLDQGNCLIQSVDRQFTALAGLQFGTPMRLVASMLSPLTICASKAITTII